MGFSVGAHGSKTVRKSSCKQRTSTGVYYLTKGPNIWSFCGGRLYHGFGLSLQQKSCGFQYNQNVFFTYITCFLSSVLFMKQVKLYGKEL